MDVEPSVMKKRRRRRRKEQEEGGRCRGYRQSKHPAIEEAAGYGLKARGEYGRRRREHGGGGGGGGGEETLHASLTPGGSEAYRDRSSTR